MTTASPSLARAREIAEKARINRGAYKMGRAGAEWPDTYLAKAIAAALDAEWNSAVEACAGWHDGQIASLQRRLKQARELGAAYHPSVADQMIQRIVAHQGHALGVRALKRTEESSNA